MKALIVGLPLALLTSLCALAQKSPVKFGEIPMADMTMKIYDKDSSASAVVLVDYGEVYFDMGLNTFGGLNYDHHVRIKILKKNGFRWGDAAILLYHEIEHVTRLQATTYNLENGKIVATDLSNEGIFLEKVNRSFDLQKFAMPNVKEGSVLEYSYTVKSGALFNLPNWQFQSEIPVRWSEYWALIPHHVMCQKYMQGYIAPTTYEVKSRNGAKFQVDAHHWIAQDVPAFGVEPFMTSKQNYIGRVNLAPSHVTYHGRPTQEIMGTWEKLNKDLLAYEGFGKVVNSNGFLKKKAEELTAGVTDPQQKVAAIYTYVQKTLAWTNMKDLYADNLRKVFDDGKGTAADINFALASMLEKVNVSVEMVLVSTRDHGFIRREYPMASQFNYVICSVILGDKRFLLDATDRYLPMGILPEHCLNGEGLLISNTGPRWIPIEPKAKARTVINTALVLNATGGLKGNVKYTHEGYAAREFRQAYFTKGEKEYMEDFLADKTWGVESTEFQNQSDISQGVEQLHSLDISEHATVTDDMIYINPFVTGQASENIFKSETRVYPVDFGRPEEKTYMCRITIPDGYVVESLPKPRMLVMPENGARYTYSITQTGNQLSVVSILQINKSMFVMDEYPHLREFYNELVAKQAEQIVLKRQ
jgi:hypothetical protein